MTVKVTMVNVTAFKRERLEALEAALRVLAQEFNLEVEVQVTYKHPNICGQVQEAGTWI